MKKILFSLLILFFGLSSPFKFEHTYATQSFHVISEIPVGVSPAAIAINPSTNLIYVTNYGEGTISVIDGKSNIIVDIIQVGNSPYGIAVNPDTNKIYVADYFDVIVIDGKTNEIIKNIPLPHGSRGIAVNPVTNKIYVTLLTGHPDGYPYVGVINGTTNSIIYTILTSNDWSDPSGIAVNPKTNLIYVREGSNKLIVIDGNTNSVIDTVTMSISTDSILGIGVNSITNLIYVLNDYWSGPIYVVDGNNNHEIVKTIFEPTDRISMDIGINEATNQIFISGYKGVVNVLDGATNEFIGEPISISGTLRGVAANPITNIVYVSGQDTERTYVLGNLPVFDLPFQYDGSKQTFAKSLLDTDDGGRVESWLDHEKPNYSKNQAVRPFDGLQYNKIITRNDKITCFDRICYDGHPAIDFKTGDINNPKELIYSVASGTVREYRIGNTIYGSGASTGLRAPSYGNYVLIDHGNRWATFYAHLDSLTPDVHEGWLITDPRNMPIGRMGGTGGWPIHLHFGVFYDKDNDDIWEESFLGYSEAVDPYGWNIFNLTSDNDPHASGTDGVTSYYMWKYKISNTSLIGAEGGTASSVSAIWSINIPSDALTEKVTFNFWDAPQVSEPSAQLRSLGNSFYVQVFDASSGMGINNKNRIDASFQKPVTITGYYSQYHAPHLDISKLTIYHWNENNSGWYPIPTTIDIVQQNASGQTLNMGIFNMQAPLICSDDVNEPNDSYLEASNILSDGSENSNYFDIDIDEDWFYLPASLGDAFKIETDSLSTGVDTEIQIIDIDGEAVLASNDNYGGNLNSLLHWIAPYDGTFFIRVFGNPTGIYGCSSFYKLRVIQEGIIYLPMVFNR